jgi:hypothetical protein
MRYAMLLVAVALPWCGSVLAAEPTVIFEDPFDGKLAEGWTWLRENPDAWRIQEDALEIQVEPGVANTVKNALLRPAPDRGKGKYARSTPSSDTAPNLLRRLTGRDLIGRLTGR